MYFKSKFKECSKYTESIFMVLRTPCVNGYLAIWNQKNSYESNIMIYKIVGGKITADSGMNNANRKRKVIQPKGLLRLDVGGRIKYFVACDDSQNICEIVDSTNERLENDFSNFTLIEKLTLSNLKERFINLILKDITYMSLNVGITDVLNDKLGCETITNLRLRGNNLTSIPKEIRYFKNLRVLSLSFNRIVELDEELFSSDSGLISTLKHLDLSHNRIKKLSMSLFDSKNLKFLSLDHNQIETLPDKIENLINLNHLFLSSNQLSCLPPTILNLQNLQFCNLYKNPFYQFGSQPVHIKLKNEVFPKLYDMCMNTVHRKTSQSHKIPLILRLLSRYDERRTCFCGDKVFQESRRAMVEVNFSRLKLITRSKITFRRDVSENCKDEIIPFEVVSCSQDCFLQHVTKLRIKMYIEDK